MQITCNGCHKRYKIRDDKLPVGKKIATRCPACKGLIQIDMRKKGLVPAASKTASKKEPVRTNEVATQPEPMRASPKTESKHMALKFGLLRSLNELPAMPEIVLKAQEVLSDPNFHMRQLVKVVEIEPAIVTRVLKIANSAYYGCSKRVASVHHASTMLGYEVLREVVTLAGVSNLLNHSLKGYGLDANDAWRHSMAVAAGSKTIARQKFPALENDAFTAGLLHDTGKLILDQYVYDHRDDFETAMQNGQKTFLWAEREIFGFDHAEIASEFCRKWNIPSTLAVAIQLHHAPSDPEKNPLAYILHAADVLAMQSNLGSGSDSHLYEPEEGTMEFLGLSERDQTRLMEEMADAVENISSDMDVTKD